MDNRFQAAQEISKVYHALNDRDSLQSYFLQSLTTLISTSSAALYLAGNEDNLWLELNDGFPDDVLPRLKVISESIQISGKPFLHKDLLGVPLIAGSTCFGAAIIQKSHQLAISDEDRDVIKSLGMEFASAIKGIRLLEENVRMERLAAIGQTSSMVVHELKNILQLARLSEEMLNMGVRDNNTKFIEMGTKKIRHALKEMDGFIWEMLSLARDQKLEAEPFPIKDLFVELADDLQTKTKACSAILKWEVPENFQDVYADRKALFRVLLNLVKNAYEAKRGDAITVLLKVEFVDSIYYRIVIQDDGEGMTEQTRARLFQAFHTTKGERGTGLGLMVVQRTIALHQGRIDIETELGKGTRFLITLPLNPLSDLLSRIHDKTRGGNLAG